MPPESSRLVAGAVALTLLFNVILLGIGCGRHRHVAVRREPELTSFHFMMRRAAPSAARAANTRFADVAQAAGLSYAWQIPGDRPLTILQTIGNGCAFLDYDGDGNLDILLVGPKPALYRGDGHGHFTDVTAATGLDRLSGNFLGCAVGDYDNDGFPDIYLSAYRGGILLHNEQGTRAVPAQTGSPGSIREQGQTRTQSRRFRDVTREAGIAAQPWGTSCAFADIDGDGHLDLYIADYVVYDTTSVPQLCTNNGTETSCGPLTYLALKGVCYHNDGNGHFTDCTERLGLGQVSGKGLGVAFANLTGSNRPALAIANDEMPGDLMWPVNGKGHPHFENRAVPSGIAFDRNGNRHGGMGIDWGDFDNDGMLDLFVATYQLESRSLYRNSGDGLFSDIGEMRGLGAECAQFVAFGCKFLDYDNDGNLDIMIANGHVQDNIVELHPTMTYRQPTQIMHNSGGKTPTFEDMSAASPDLMRPIVGRGLAIGDYDNDGRMDALVVDGEGKPLLLHNECPNVGHWLGVSLVGTRSNRDGYGARLTVTCGKRTLVRHCHADGSYLSSSDARVHVGLGAAKIVDRLTIHWPSGHIDVLKHIPVDRYFTVCEGSSYESKTRNRSYSFAPAF